MLLTGRRTTDEPQYKEKHSRQYAIGQYYYQSPQPTQPTAFPMDTWIRPQSSGAPLSTKYKPVDVETDLRGVGRPLSRAPRGATTLAADTHHATGSAVGHGGHHIAGNNPVRVDGTGSMTGLAGSIQSAITGVIGHTDVPHLRTADNRLTHPALGLKGVAMNRFDPVLFHNPAEEAFTPFDRVVDTRLASKDRWRIPACSLRRLKLMTHRAGTNTQPKPVFTDISHPKVDVPCAKERARLVSEYASKIVDHDPARVLPSSSYNTTLLPTDTTGCNGGRTQQEMMNHYRGTIVTHDPMPSCG